MERSRTQKLIQVTRVIQAVIDKSWIPEELRDWTFFSPHDLWEYTSDNTVNRCENCDEFVGMTFFGDELRSVFPNLVILEAHEIWPNVHQTLWDTPTCKCRLKRTFLPTAPRYLEIHD